MRKLLLLALTLVVSVAVTGAYGGPPTVPCEVKGQGASSYSNLQAAVDAANVGDTLRVRGTCIGNTVIDRSLTITGQGKEATIDGGNQATVIQIGAAATLTLTRLTITNGGINGGAPYLGGGIRNLGTLTIRNSNITDNHYAGGVYNAGVLTVNNSSINGNGSESRGGGLHNTATGSATLDHIIVTGNETHTKGGGLYNVGTLTVADSNVDNNLGLEGWGGIGNLGGTVIVTRSSLSDNLAASGDVGGGLGTGGGTVVIDRSRITGNRAQSCGGIAISGEATVTLRDTSVANNRAPFGGGGICNHGTLAITGKSTVTGNAIDAETSYHGGGIYNDGTLQGAIPGPGGNVYNNIPDDIYPYP